MIVQGSFEYRYSDRAWPWVEPGSENVRTENEKRVHNLIFVVCNVFNSNIYVILESKEGQVMN